MDEIINKINGKRAFWEGFIIGQDIILNNSAHGTQRYEAAKQMKLIAENEILWCKMLIQEIRDGISKSE